MKHWLSILMIHFTSHPLILVMIITFLESLAMIGLFLPGIVLMSTIGTLIGKGQISFFTSWITSIIACSIGDYISYYIGWKFKKIIYRIKIFKKNIHLFHKIQYTLNKYSTFTILFGKFIGPTRPLIPMMSGMLQIPIKKFIFPSFMGCTIWPILYFMPGIITGMMIKDPHYTKKLFSHHFLISLIIFIIILLIYIFWKYKKYLIKKINNH
ncbi:DedA family protein [Buchnera aphidicola]|uniref:DedA family protein n=1 Tax=Buchnera aphidicola TaxID=9 RepID=UPI003463BF78